LTPDNPVDAAAVPCPRLLIAGVSSGVGKTTLTVGLCRALQRRGLSVTLFKCGPDYLDPTYHRRASRGAVHNLDSWLMSKSALHDTFVRNAARTDINVIEGVMGLFDGASPTQLTGSSAEIAQWLQAPIALVCDASGMARSVAALIHGFTHFEPSIAPAAVICNRIGSTSHLELLKRAHPGPPAILGGLPKRPEQRFPERHLGLIAAQELDIEAQLEAWADLVEAHCDVSALVALARSAPPLTAAAALPAISRPRARIGVARDEAFHFYYDENLYLLEVAGAELVEFSPLNDELPDVDGLYIGGGYPELHAARLAANTQLLRQVCAHSQGGKPIYAECGGLMYLAQGLVDRAGAHHALAGIIPGVAIMQDKLQALGYVRAQTLDDSPLGAAGTAYSGHQFRYSIFQAPEAPKRLLLHNARGDRQPLEGYGNGHIFASYVHGHWSSNPQIPHNFVAACAPGT